MGRLWQSTNDSDEPQSITLDSIQTHLQSYPSHVPPKFQALDVLRLEEIPAKLIQRKQDGKTYLEKSEVASLVEWKLKHGTFRPNLANLVASNSDSDILSTTKSAFAIYEADNDAYADSIKTLSKLKGIGPATASLLLSCYDPVRTPFFSDQLFRYAIWQRVAGCGWDRKIKYTMKEYTEMYEKVQALRERLKDGSGQQVSALTLEKLAYVLGKEAVLDSKRYGGQEEKGASKDEPVPSSQKSKKRKNAIAGDEKPKEEQEQQQPATRKRKKTSRP